MPIRWNPSFMLRFRWLLLFPHEAKKEQQQQQQQQRHSDNNLVKKTSNKRKLQNVRPFCLCLFVLVVLQVQYWIVPTNANAQINPNTNLNNSTVGTDIIQPPTTEFPPQPSIQQQKKPPLPQELPLVAFQFSNTTTNYIQNQHAPPFHMTLTTNNNNKTLVVLTGNLRGGEISWQSLYRHVLDVNNADLALVIGDVPTHYQNSSILQRAKYIWHVPEYEDWADAMELIPNKQSNWKEQVFGKSTNNKKKKQRSILLGGANGIKGSGALVFMYRWFASQYLQQYNLIDQYERFVISRTDHYYGCPHNLSTLDMDKLWVPEGQDYRGICDRHLVVNQRDVLQAMNILPPLVQRPERYQDILHPTATNTNMKNNTNTTGPYNTEQFLQRRWMEERLWNRVSRCNRTMFVASAPGDETRWRTAVATFQNVGVKYRSELAQVRLVCSSYWRSQKSYLPTQSETRTTT